MRESVPESKNYHKTSLESIHYNRISAICGEDVFESSFPERAWYLAVFYYLSYMLSKDQLKAVRITDGPAMVLAGPGSGKTTVITNRIKYLIEQGISPEKILVITFTRAAAVQMQERFRKLTFPYAYRVTFGTFHAVFFQILKHAYGYTNESILREEERRSIVMDLARNMDMETGDLKEWAQDALAEISKVKSEQIPIDYYYSSSTPEEEFRRIYTGYRKRQEQLSKIDFDDMCVYTADLFHARKDILGAWQKRFEYILVDEFQDINLLQYQIVRQLAAPGDNLFIVGDDDQSIYRFRGSRPEIMLGFPKDYPGAQVVNLRKNYRSTDAIVAASLAVINQNKSRFQKDLVSAGHGSEPIEFMECTDMDTQMLYLVKSIRDSLKKGIRPGEIAILTRTNTEVREPSLKLAQFQIPCKVKDVVPVLWDHWIALDLIAYLRLSPGDMDRQDFLRVCNRPTRYITRKSAYARRITFEGLRAFYQDKEWMKEYLDSFEDHLKMIRPMRPYAAINYVRRGAGYDEYLKDYANKRKIDVGELMQLADEIQDSSKGCRTLDEWLEKIEQNKSVLEEQKKAAGEAGSDCVTLATLHAAKGLEFTQVFLINVNEGIIPWRRAVMEAEIEEERRLFYVGMTRAKKKLHILYVKERYNRKMQPSRFLEPLKTMARTSYK